MKIETPKKARNAADLIATYMSAMGIDGGEMEAGLRAIAPTNAAYHAAMAFWTGAAGASEHEMADVIRFCEDGNVAAIIRLFNLTIND